MSWDLTRGDWGAPPNTAPAMSVPVSINVLHHTAGPFLLGVAAARSIERTARERGFANGYSYTGSSDRQGTLIEGRGFGRQGGHTRGYNSRSHALSLVGNLDVNAVPDGMIRGAVRYCRMHARFGPARFTHGHRDLGSTACPGRHAYARISAINAAVSGTPTAPEVHVYPPTLAKAPRWRQLDYERNLEIVRFIRNQAQQEMITAAAVIRVLDNEHEGARRIDWWLARALNPAWDGAKHLQRRLRNFINDVLDERETR